MRQLTYLAFILGAFILMGAKAPDPHKLNVSAQATIKKPADQLILQIGVVTQNTNVNTALAANNEKMQKIYSALRKLDLKDTEMETGQFSITPQWSAPPKNPPVDWRAQITGYEVQNILRLTTDHLELAGSLIDALTQEGANKIEDIQFTIKNRQHAELEAIQEAVQLAKSYAETAAQAAQVKMGDVIELTVQPQFVTPYHRSNMFALAKVDANTPIEAGEVEISASVNLSIELLSTDRSVSAKNTAF